MAPGLATTCCQHHEQQQDGGATGVLGGEGRCQGSHPRLREGRAAPMFKGKSVAREVGSGGMVPTAPRYFPTEEQFQDPLAFVQAIRAEAEPYGICSIRPPASWAPPYAMDKARFSFKTRLQAIHELSDRGGSACQQWRASYNKFLAVTGSKVSRKNPILNGTSIDLPKLHKAVQKRGGYQAVIDDKRWKEVARIVGMQDFTINHAYNLRMVYLKLLQPFNDWLAAHPEESPEQVGKPAPPPKVKEEQWLPPKKRVKSEAIAKMEENDESDEDERVPENIDSLLCEFCKGGHYEDQIILCDRCDHGFHLFCLSPPLENVPEGDWVCPHCLAQDSDAYCFKEGQVCSLDEFQALAEEFRDEYQESLASKLGKDISQLTWMDLEREFWRIVEEAEEPVEVLYGADLDTGIYGSGFPLSPSSIDEKEAAYSKHVWNINNFPTHGGQVPSLLRHIKDKIPGVMVPWMYVGMMYSAFCWHIEDHMFYSINYMHWGEAKRWYSVPAYATAAFEAAFHEWLPDQMAMQPDLLFQLVTLLSPEKLNQSGVPVYGLVQEAHDFVVTFPCAYHGGFNTGFNCAEAVNFCPPDWLRFGSVSQERYRHFRRPPVLSLEELILKCSAEGDLSPEAAAWMAIELERVSEDERALRTGLWAKGVKRASRVEQEAGLLPGQEEDPECSICHSILHYSAVKCHNNRCEGGKSRLVCLHHVDQLCECGPRHHNLLFRHSCAELDEALQRVKVVAAKSQVAPDWGLFRKPARLKGACSAVDAMEIDPEAHDTHRVEGLVELEGGAGEDPSGVSAAEGALKRGVAPSGTGAAVALRVSSGEEGVKVELVLASPGGEVGTKREREEVEAEGPATVGDDPYPKLSQTLAAREKMLRLYLSAPEVPVAPSTEEKLVAAYRKWMEESKALLAAGRAKMTDLDNAICGGSAFSWGWNGMLEGKAVVEELQEARAWGKACQALCHKKNLLTDIEAIVAREPQPAMVYGLKRLRDNVAAAKQLLPRLQNLSSRLAEKVTTPLVTLAELEEVVCDAVRNPNVEFPIARPLQELVSKANKWGNTLRQTLPLLLAPNAACASGVSEGELPSLRTVEALYREGTALGVKMPQVETLDGLLARVGVWRAEAAAALPAKSAQPPSLETLATLRKSGLALGVSLPELTTIKERVQKAEGWSKKYADLTARSATIEELKELLRAGELVGVALPDLPKVRESVAQSSRQTLLLEAAAGKELALVELREMLEGVTGESPESSDVQMLREKLKQAEEVAARLDALVDSLGKSSSELALSDVEAELSKASVVGVQLPQVGVIEDHVSKARQWVVQAEAVLAPPAPGAPRRDAAAVENLVTAATSSPFKLAMKPELLALKQQMDEWAARAEALLSQGSDTDAAAVQSHMKAARSLGVVMREEASLAGVVAPSLWAQRVADILDAKGTRPSLMQADALLAEGTGASLDVELLERLRAAVGATREWGDAASAALNCGRVASARKTAEQLRATLEVAASLVVAPEGMERLEAALRANQRWEEEACSKVEGAEAAGRRLTSAEVHAIVEAGMAIPVASQRLEELYMWITGMEDWEADLVDFLAKKGSRSTKLDGLLTSLHRSAGAFASLLRCAAPGLKLEPANTQASARYALATFQGAAEACLCLQDVPDGDRRSHSKGGSAQWIGCDFCLGWYHIKCLGMNPQKAASLRTKYSCHICAALRPGCSDTEPVIGPEAMGRVSSTARPALSVLRDSLSLAQKLPVESKYEAELGSAVLTLELATASSDLLVDRHLRAMSSDVNLAGSHTDALPEAQLRLLLRAAIGCEADCTALAERLVLGMRLLRWRAKVDAILQRGEEPATINVDSLSRLIRDGAALGLTAADCKPLKELSRRLETVRDWMALARRALASRPPHEEALRTLLAAGRHVRCAAKVDRLLADLQDAITTYCYCRQVYDAEREMVACDTCSEWYHYSCVGLSSPSTSGGAPVAVGDEYRCPSCTAKAGGAVDLAALPEASRAAVQSVICTSRSEPRERRDDGADPMALDEPSAVAPAKLPASESSQVGAQTVPPQIAVPAQAVGSGCHSPMPMQTGLFRGGAVNSPVYARAPNCHPPGVI